MDIPRFVAKKVLSQIGKQKVIMLYGSRRTGKTTLIEEIYQSYAESALFLLGEDAQVAEVL